MEKKLFLFLMSLIIAILPAFSASETPERFINKSLYNNVYQSTLNNKNNNGMKTVQASKTNPNPGVPKGNRRVVKRKNIARAAATPAQPSQPRTTTANNAAQRRPVVSRSNTARVGTQTATASRNQTATARTQNAKRNVVARSAVGVQRNRSASVIRNASTNSTTKTHLSTQQCFANYKECMDSYCERKDTAYDRCFCSAKLSQIDAKYQNKIDSLMQQIIKLRYTTNATDEEIKSYWDETVGVYTQTNPWTNIDNALDINWADTESRVRGQNAFTSGHTYCVNNLRSCSYMTTNMRDAYKSEIERDCATYEKGLEKIQMAAESVIKSYNQ